MGKVKVKRGFLFVCVTDSGVVSVSSLATTKLASIKACCKACGIKWNVLVKKVGMQCFETTVTFKIKKEKNIEHFG